MGLPEPVYDVDGITVYHGDCLELLPRLPAVDAVISDPPYGISYQHSGGGKGVPARRNAKMPLHGDDADFDPTPWLAWPCLLWGANHYAARLPKGGSWLAWDKSEGRGPADSFADGEFAWTSVPSIKRNVVRYLWKGIACEKAGESGGRRWHPTQKPVAVMRWCLDLLDLPEDALILDPYAGSGTTGVAARRTGRRCILIEKDARYIPTIIRRLREAETPLFATHPEG